MADETKTPPPELEEIALITQGRDVTRGYVDPFLLLLPTDSVLRTRGGGDYKIYEEILRDDQVASTFQQRRRAVVSRPWEVVAGGERPIDVEAADFIRQTLERIRFDRVTEKMLFGIFYGYAVAECLWQARGERIELEAVKVKKQRRFRFDGQGRMRLITQDAPQGLLLPPQKFWTFTTGADNDDEPYGLGLGHWLYWPTFFKRNGVKFWLLFLEKFGTPTVIGKHPPTATDEERRRLLEAAIAVQTDAAVTIPDSMQLTLLEAMRSGNVDQRAFYATMDAAIAKIVLSQTMTTDDGASRSQGEVHMDVRAEVVKSDADLICESFNDGPVRWLCEWNFPGAALPQVWRKMENVEQLERRAKLDKTIAEIGTAKPTLDYIRDTYGGEWEPVSEASKPAPAPGPVMPAFAEAPDRVGELTDELEAGVEHMLDGMLDAVRAAIESSTSYDEAREKLSALAGSLSTAAFAEVMQRGLAAAELAGLADVIDETTD